MISTHYDAMKARGFSYNTTASVRKNMVCPRCGFEFSLVYARTFACQGCPHAARGCPKVRCNKCDHEFFIESSKEVNNNIHQRQIADHMMGIINERNSDLGVVSTSR